MKACGGPRTACEVSMVFTVGVGLKVTERRPSGREGCVCVGSEDIEMRGVVSEVFEFDAMFYVGVALGFGEGIKAVVLSGVRGHIASTFGGT